MPTETTHADPRDLTRTFDQLFEPWDRSDAPGLVIGVAMQGRLLYRRGFGMASLEHGVANSPSTRMRIGSASKHFACVAALLLAEEGRLDIDAPADRWLPELPRLAGMPTLRQFMNHTSGYRDYVDLIALTAAGVLQPPGCGLAMQARQSGVNFAPGRSQLYCNGGYHLLSIAIERAAGMPFERFLAQRLFEPLGMVDTASIPSDMSIEPRMATLHAPASRGGWRRGLFITEEIRGEGAIVSTVDDMLRWIAHLRAPDRIGRPETWRTMAEPVALDNGLHSVYAMGLHRHAHRGLDVIYHSGAVIGGMCQMLTVPAHGLDVVVMTNGARVSPIELAWKVVEAVLPDALRGDAVARPASRRFAALLGQHYQSEEGHVLGFADVGGMLGVSYAGSPAAPILRDEGDTLRIGFEDVAAGPLVWRVADLKPGAKRAPERITLTEAGNVVELTRLPRRAPTTASLAPSLVGRYACGDLDAHADLRLDGRQLVMHITGSYGSLRMGIEPWSPDVLKLGVLDPRSDGNYTAHVERRRGKVTALRLTSLRTRGLRFERVKE